MKRAIPGVPSFRRTLKRTLKQSLRNRRDSPRSYPLFGIAALMVSLAAPPAGASENGAAHYPTGTNSVAPALMPPPASHSG